MGRKKILAVAVGLVVILGTVSILSSNTSHTTKAIRTTPVLLRKSSSVRNVAVGRRLAAQMGDSHPDEIAVVDTTRAKALQVISPEETVVGGGAPSTPVRVFAMRGTFIDPGPRPPHSASPKGTWLVVSINMATRKVLDLSLTDERPDLASLGSIRWLVGRK